MNYFFNRYALFNILRNFFDMDFFVIHCNNSEMIHILEENHLKMNEDCFF